MDWKNVVSELQGFGLTQPQIAAVCGCRQTTISALATGKTADPSHSLGEALKALLAQKRAEKADAADAPVPAAGLHFAPDRRDPTKPSPYVGTDIDRRAPATEG